MSPYKRSTRQCNFNELRYELITAIRDHQKRYRLTGEDIQPLACIETTSRDLSDPGFFDRLRGNTKRTNITTIFMTPTMVYWGLSDTRKLVIILSARLAEIEVKDYEETDSFQKREDEGLELTGRANGGQKKGTYFIGLGLEPAAVEFRQILKDAALKAKISMKREEAKDAKRTF